MDLNVTFSIIPSIPFGGWKHHIYNFNKSGYQLLLMSIGHAYMPFT